MSIRLDPDALQVSSFETAPWHAGAETDPPETEPNTWEDTCINMCPTDDTCTMLGCTKTA